MELINAALDNCWPFLQTGLQANTPDIVKGSQFSITAVNPQTVEITTSGGTPIPINRNAFLAALEYLVNNSHTTSANPCQIGSNFDNPSPLDSATRTGNQQGNLMVVSYLIPLLSLMNLVDIDGTRPNTTWLK